MVKSVSIIIPVYNGERTIRECLESVTACQCITNVEKEIIVVNNNSTDATSKIVSEFKNVKMVNEAVPTSYAARNRGIIAAQGDVLAFIDDDCIVSKKWLVSAFECFIGSNKSLLVSGPIFGKKGNDIQRFLDEDGTFDARSSYRSCFFPTANLFVRKKDALAVNGFNYRLVSGGDRDFCWKTIANGAMLILSDGTAVTHVHRDTERGLYLQSYKYGCGGREIIRNYSANDYSSSSFVQDALKRSFSFPKRMPRHNGDALKALLLKKIGKPQLFYKLLKKWANSKGYQKKSEALKKNEIVILTYPDYRREKSYQQEFYSALGKQLPTTVFYENRLKLSVFNKYLACINILHFSCLDAIWGNFYRKKIGRQVLLKIIKKAKAQGVVVAWTMHDLVSHDSKNIAQELRNLEELLPHFDIILYMSEASKKLLTDKMGVAEEKLVFSPHGVFKWPEPKKSDQTFKQYLKIKKGDKLILFFGRVRNYKGILEIASSWNQQQVEHYHLVIVGKPDKECTKSIEALKGKYKNVHIIDRFVEENEIPWMLHGSDTAIFPYKKILNSGSVIQAMQYSVPILASNAGAIADLAKDYPELITTLDDWSQLNEQKILSAIEKHNPEVTSRFIKDHSWEKSVESLVNRLVDSCNVRKKESIDISKPLKDFWRDIDLPKILIVGDVSEECENLNAIHLRNLFIHHGSERYINSELEREYFDAVFLGHIPTESEIKEANRVLVRNGLLSVYQSTQRMEDLSEYGFVIIGIRNCSQGFMQFYEKSQDLELVITAASTAKKLIKHQYRIGLDEGINCDTRLSRDYYR